MLEVFSFQVYKPFVDSLTVKCDDVDTEHSQLVHSSLKCVNAERLFLQLYSVYTSLSSFLLGSLTMLSHIAVLCVNNSPNCKKLTFYKISMNPIK